MVDWLIGEIVVWGEDEEVGDGYWLFGVIFG